MLVIIGAAAAGFVQGLSGFAFGLVAMSFWAWAIPPEQAAAMAVFGAWAGQVASLLAARRKARLTLLLPFVAGGLAGIPVGVGILPHLDIQLFKAVLGAILLTWCPAMLLAHRLPRITAGGRLADGAVGVLGGIMCGFGGFSGALPTLWCTLKGFTKEDQRAVIQNFNLSMLSVTIVIYLGTGMVSRDMLPLFAIVAPAILVPAVLGTRLYIGLTEAAFRRLVLGALTVSGAALLLSSLPKLAGRLA